MLADRPPRAPRPPGPLRVAVDLTPLLGRPTGVGVFATELVRRLAEHDDVEVHGFAATWRGRGRLQEAAPPGVRVSTRPLPARPARRLWRRSELPPIEWLTGPVDVVHGTNFVVPPARHAGRVVTVHDLTPMRFPELCNPDTLAYPALIRRAWQRGAWIHTDSEFVADELVDWLGATAADRARIVPIHLGVGPAPAGDPQRGRQHAGSERYVLAVGTIEPRKGLVDLVGSFDALVEADDAALEAALGEVPAGWRVRLVVAGPDGWGIEAFDAAVAASRHRERIVRLGWVDDGTRHDLLAGAAVLAYPSVYEGFGLPPLEAMAAGVPVVCSDAGPLPEVTGGAARLVPVGDRAGLAAALAEVLAEQRDDPPARAAAVAAGRARAARFDWDRCTEATVELYRRAGAVG